MRSSELNKVVKVKKAFCLFGGGPAPPAEGLVVKNHLLAALIRQAFNLYLALMYVLYIIAVVILLRDLELWVALAVIAFMTPYFLVTWRTIPFLKVVCIEKYAMGPPDGDVAGKIPSEKMSTLV